MTRGSPYPRVYPRSPSSVSSVLTVLSSHLQVTAPCVPGPWDDLPLSRCHVLYPLDVCMLSPVLISLSPLFYFHVPSSSISSSMRFTLLSFATGKPFRRAVLKGNSASQRSRVPSRFGVLEGGKGCLLSFLSALSTKGLARN